MAEPSYDALMRRHVVLVEYDGSAYCGSQYQHQHGEIRPTVQHAIEEALKTLKLETSKVSFSSRTDAGVHALGQVAHFDAVVGALDNVADLASALNAVLPADVSVRDTVRDLGLEFNTRREASRKWYRYSVYNGPQRSVMAPKGSFWVKHALDETAMNQAAQAMIGTHNFKSFKCPDTLVVDDVCHVEYARVTRDGEMLYFDIVATRFLYKMVRNLMGLLLAIGRDRDPLSPKVILEILEEQDQSVASQYGPTAKADGLMLMAVGYPEGMDHFKDDRRVQEMNRLVTMELPEHENLFSKAS